MATRKNACTNPGCKNNTTGWGGDTTPSRNTGLTGFPRATGASYTTSGTFVRTQLGSVTAGVQYTISVYLRANNLPISSGNIYAEWTGSGTSYTNTAYSASQSVVTRVSHTATAPTGATAVAVIIDGVGNFTINNLDVTAVLIEAAGSADTYFDGDAPGATWDGTDGNSASTLSGSTTYNQSVGGTITPAGTITKRTSRSLAGATTPTGALLKLAARVLGGTAAPAGLLRRQPAKSFAGLVAPAGAIRKLVSHLLGGSIAPSGATTAVDPNAPAPVPGALSGSAAGATLRATSSTSGAARSGTSSLNATTGP